MAVYSFLALAKVNYEKSFTIKDEKNTITARVEPVYEDGFTFSGELGIVGSSTQRINNKTLKALLLSCIKDHLSSSAKNKSTKNIPGVHIIKIDIREPKKTNVINLKRSA